MISGLGVATYLAGTLTAPRRRCETPTRAKPISAVTRRARARRPRARPRPAAAAPGSGGGRSSATPRERGRRPARPPSAPAPSSPLRGRSGPRHGHGHGRATEPGGGDGSPLGRDREVALRRCRPRHAGVWCPSMSPPGQITHLLSCGGDLGLNKEAVRIAIIAIVVAKGSRYRARLLRRRQCLECL